MCPVNGCTSTIESEDDLDTHIAANLHEILPLNPRTTNDIARYHLIDTIRSTNIESHQDTNRIRKEQNSSSLNMSDFIYHQDFTSVGWTLRTRKHTNRMSEKVKQFIENVWVESQITRSKITPELVQQQMHSLRNNGNDKKLFQPSNSTSMRQFINLNIDIEN